MNKSIHVLNGFYTTDVYYGDTESVHIENKHWDKLEKTGLIGKISYKVRVNIKTVGS